MKTKLMVVGLVAFSFAGQAMAADAVQIFKDNKCNNCHIWTGKGIDKVAKGDEDDDSGKKPHDMSKLDEKVVTKGESFVKEYLKKKETLNDKKHKKAWKGSDEDLNTLVAEFFKK